MSFHNFDILLFVTTKLLVNINVHIYIQWWSYINSNVFDFKWTYWNRWLFGRCILCCNFFSRCIQIDLFALKSLDWTHSCIACLGWHFYYLTVNQAEACKIMYNFGTIILQVLWMIFSYKIRFRLDQNRHLRFMPRALFQPKFAWNLFVQILNGIIAI